MFAYRGRTCLAGFPLALAWSCRRVPVLVGVALAYCVGRIVLRSPALAEPGDGGGVRVTVDIEEIRELGAATL